MNSESTKQGCLIRGRYIICRVLDRDDVQLLTDAALYQKNGRISDLGSWAEMRIRYPHAPVLGTGEQLIIPGLINGHHHVGVTPFQLGSPDLPLELWLAHRMRARMVDPVLDTLYSAFEQVESGVTTVQHLHGRVPPPLERITQHAHSVIGAYVQLGMRVSYSYGLRDQNRLVYEDDERFAQRLPSGLAAQFRDWVREQTLPLEDNFALFHELHQHYSDHALARIQLAPVNLHWCSDRALERVSEYSERHQVCMHMHLLETRYQREYARRRTGGSAVAHLDRMGLLNERMTLGHGVWVSEQDLDCIAERGVHVCTNASSNLRLRSGIAPWAQFQRRGINLTLGMDEAGINEDRDMLQEMRLVKNIHRTPGMDPLHVPTSADVLRMATEGGAATTPFAQEIGVLEPGRAADLVLIDFKRLAYPYLDPVVSVVDALVHRAQRKAVDTVMVDGQVIYNDGRFTQVDRDALLQELSGQLAKPLEAAELARLQLSENIYPYVQQFYKQFCLDCSSQEELYRAVL